MSVDTAAAARRTHDALARARARLVARDAETVRDQVTLAEIPSPTGEEGERGAWVARRFAALGLRDVRVDAAGNVIGRRDGESRDDRAPRVAVCAHLDTVFPRDTPLRVRHDGRRLVGPGIGDNGRGLAAMLALAEVLDGDHVRTRHAIEFVATTGEEGLGDLRGAKRYFADAPAVRAAVALDGAGDERIVHRAVGSRRFRATFAGPGGHSWAAFGVPNAVHAAARAAAAIAALPLDDAPRVTVSVGRIGGGICVNAIPADGWLEVDLRSTFTRMLDRYEQSIRRAVHAAALEENATRAEGTPPLTMRVEVIGDRPGGELAADAPLVAGALAMTRLVGRAPELGSASTDANVPLGLGVPAIAIGAGGRGGEAHTPGEWFENAEGAVGLGRALGIVAYAAELTSAR
ncbi:M20/M25/M40 family metallo-hydrolase [Roseisolibacter sp. H3M3-2]|uniref:M20/M25/M40 family metallo-hydrolase n=1 Tax=Roseisolibacter sp. H3M3-2 TaxID=3031323 RepID=UPI0023DABA61|nr:M20/M25/M40 family metallo-hydrolase [Roseisolibacter sp. H3M3-2]MDF1501441.1 M20/M25/M40 family metallo-hydrolase [Roseisolibacter sp. H3M3-2]